MSLSSALKRVAVSSLSRTGFSALPVAQRSRLERDAAIGQKSQKLGMIGDGDLRKALGLLPVSQSQLNQDLFVLSELGWKRDGFFVEFGATDGKTLSNSWLLEKEFGWTGILSEPARTWREALGASGRAAKIDYDCVWSRTGETLHFTETDWAELSTISQFTGSDSHKRDKAKGYDVATVSLNDLLMRHGAPDVMDYLSIDTEGSEFEILQNLDFAKYRFRCITCEHNRQPVRDDIHRLLSSHGYRRKFEEISDFDDWYVHEAG